MDLLERIRLVVQVLVAMVMGFWAMLPALTQLLVWLMVADTALGLMIAIRKRDLSAQVAWTGATKKIGSLILIGVAGLVNPHVQGIIEVNLVQAASAFYIVPELTSISRNAAILHVPVFVQMSGLLRYFQAASGAPPAKEDESKTPPV